jgi:CBS domain containing-hemolysin-like protein
MEIIIIVALTVVNGIFAMTEMALMSSRKTRFYELAVNSDAEARDALFVFKEPNGFLYSTKQAPAFLEHSGKSVRRTLEVLRGFKSNLFSPVMPTHKELAKF